LTGSRSSSDLRLAIAADDCHDRARQPGNAFRVTPLLSFENLALRRPRNVDVPRLGRDAIAGAILRRAQDRLAAAEVRKGEREPVDLEAVAGRDELRRVLLVLPILVLWANVHGSVVLGALLTTVAGLLLVARTLRNSAGAGNELLLRGALLAIAPCLCIFASPYGSSLFHYYGSTAFNSSFGRIVSEWQHSWPSRASSLR